MSRLFLPFLLCLFSLCIAEESSPLKEGVILDLRNPAIQGKNLSTEEGGVIQSKELRVQAQKITYTRSADGEFVQASDNVLLDYGDYHIVADALDYNFTTHEGHLFVGRSGYGLWYFGGSEMILHSDGSLTLKEGYLTTSDLLQPDWKLEIKEANLSADHYIRASSLFLYAGKLPFFYVPSLQTRLDWITDHPFRYRLRWGGKQGLRFGITYLAHEWNELKTYVRLDYRLKRGPGGGIETLWANKSKTAEFHTVNYIANDNSIERRHQKTRYRIEGGSFFQTGSTQVRFSYDRVSDEDMPNDYYDNGLALDTVCPTHLHIHYQKKQLFLVNFHTRLRLNDFQTLKQELPVLFVSHRPFNFKPFGVIMENRLSAGYLNFRFAHKELFSHNFDSARIEWHHHSYRSLHWGPLILTPEGHYHAIFYSTTPQKKEHWLQVAQLEALLNAPFYRLYGALKHTIEPYMHYTYITTPTLSPHEHYIFDMQDGWHSLHSLRYGIRQSLYAKLQGAIKRRFYNDIFAYAFFNNRNIKKTIPRVYQESTWDISDTLRQSLCIAWDCAHNQLAHLNVRTEWTISTDSALRAEYRHRNRYDYRKIDYYNFILEAAHPENLLTASTLSDQRDVLLCHFFYRLQYNLTAEFQFRHGWNRKKEPCYTEYQIDLTTTLRSHWTVRLSWQNREHDRRLVLNISLGDQ